MTENKEHLLELINTLVHSAFVYGVSCVDGNDTVPNTPFKKTLSQKWSANEDKVREALEKLNI